MLLAYLLQAQAPQGFNYPTIVRNGNGDVVSNQQVSFRLSLTNSDGTVAHYSEKHLVTITPQGIANLCVGEGTVLTGIFLQLKPNNYFIR
jgi:hypothetical protein